MAKKIDLTGERFGLWRVLSDAGITGRIRKWHCVCDCGNTRTVQTSQLRSGKSTCCGSRTHRIGKDLAGLRFGRLSLIERVEDRSNQSMWKCRCDCGNIAVCSVNDMRRGKTKSCGCLSTEVRREKELSSWRQAKQYLHAHGYMIARCPDRRKHIGVHRLVMEDSLGRPLQPWEHVHHKNGDRTDNRPENLELVKCYHGAGQKAGDLVMAKNDSERQRLISEAVALLAAAGIEWTPPILTPKP